MSRSETAGANRRTERKGESATPTRDTERESGPAKARRDTKRPIVVHVSADKRADIERRAKAANCSLAEYMRSAAMGLALRSRADADAVLALAEAHAALERLQALVERLVSKPPEEATDDGVRAVVAAFSECERRLAAAADALA